ncbi:mitochondrial amino-acid acetyltransferase [Myxozyma melibiosi]|uniref:Amino-acid acetyltransferase, mitochondrial n=1 Tax=Myxozyma melibiosi TaxID=54550 RepID=A0ABR1FAQ9_9ASCO
MSNPQTQTTSPKSSPPSSPTTTVFPLQTTSTSSSSSSRSTRSERMICIFQRIPCTGNRSFVAARGGLSLLSNASSLRAHFNVNAVSRLVAEQDSDLADDLSESKELILSVLRSNATKRDARNYITKYSPSDFSAPALETKLRKDFSKKLLTSVSDAAGSFDLYGSAPIELRNMIRVAVVKISAVDSIEEQMMANIGTTVARLARLGLSPVIVVDPADDAVEEKKATCANRKQTKELARISERVAAAIEKPVNPWLRDQSRSTQNEKENITKNKRPRSVAKAETLPALFTHGKPGDPIKLTLPHLLLLAMTNNIVPIVSPLVYSDALSRYSLTSADDVVYEIVTKISAINEPDIIAVEKVIYIDPRGGIPSKERNSGAHILVNLEQEADDILAELAAINASESHIKNLNSFRKLLAAAPATTSGLITTPDVAGLQSTRNPLIYNLLTDRPVISSSLPVEGKKATSHSTTLLRHGMPVMMFYSDHGMRFPDLQTPSSLFPHRTTTPHKVFNGIQTVPSNATIDVDMRKLIDLIENSFGKHLDTAHYLSRINGNIAGLIIAGDYEGGAIVTWEYMRDGTKVAYLDKLAVLRKNQGSAGVADIVFKAMVMQLFPDELIWRSRTVNPVNRWYFERSKGSLRLPGENKKWTMFWTGKETRERDKLDEYATICSSIEPSLK